MNRLGVRVVAVAVGALALLVGAPAVASAHPLGNFTVNRYSGVVVSPESVTVDHVLDIAEIPTAQRSPAIDTSGDGHLSRPELASWAVTACTDATRSLRLTVGGTAAALEVRSSAARSPCWSGCRPSRARTRWATSRSTATAASWCRRSR